MANMKVSIIAATLFLTLLTSCRAEPLLNSTKITNRLQLGDQDDNYLFNSSETRGAAITPKGPDSDKTRWPNRMVPYLIDDSFTGDEAQFIKAVMEEYSRTCVRFVPRTKETNYLQIFDGNGCWSYTGMINGGAQKVSLQRNGCLFKQTILHVLGHAVGFYNEHSRSDRDDWVTIQWQNIQSGREHAFAKVQPKYEKIYTQFDYNSIMMYDSYAFSKNGEKTIVTKDPSAVIGNQDHLSPMDIETVNKMYKCK